MYAEVEEVGLRSGDSSLVRETAMALDGSDVSLSFSTSVAILE